MKPRAGPPRRAADRALAWLVTGPIGRGGAFFVDFAAALGRGLRSLARQWGRNGDR